ncbi:ictacalcin-like [Engraulis encrasicolus]|uniref:ictacalcin-like n=1 Tax=Engraulis encrasicolus TaxID=184585 RepID=UPI002FCFECB1
MSTLKEAMATLIEVFHKYAGGDELLNKAELKVLLEREFGDMLVLVGNLKDPRVADGIFRRMDLDGSGSVDFAEFVTMVAEFTAAINNMHCR